MVFKSLTRSTYAVVITIIVLIISACGGGGGADTEPDTFVLTNKTQVEPNTSITSNLIAITGIDTDVIISITDGEYSLDGSSFTVSG